MPHFGDCVGRLRKESGLTLTTLAKKLGSHKGYVSDIEKGKVNPPSLKLIRKYAKFFGLDLRSLLRLAWVDKAPELIKVDAERFLVWCESEEATKNMNSSHAPAPIALRFDGSEQSRS